MRVVFIKCLCLLVFIFIFVFVITCVFATVRLKWIVHFIKYYIKGNESGNNPSGSITLIVVNLFFELLFHNFPNFVTVFVVGRR